MSESKQVGTVKVTLNFRVMRNEKDSAFELMAPDDDEVVMVAGGLNEIRDLLAEKFVDAGIHNFEVEVKQS